MAATSAESDMARFAPAASTFAPSRKDVLSSLAFFFGDPASPEKLRDYSEHNAATCALNCYRTPNTLIPNTHIHTQ